MLTGLITQQSRINIGMVRLDSLVENNDDGTRRLGSKKLKLDVTGLDVTGLDWIDRQLRNQGFGGLEPSFLEEEIPSNNYSGTSSELQSITREMMLIQVILTCLH